MDVMRPEIYCIGKRYYRLNPVKESHRGRSNVGENRPYREEDEEEFRRTYDEGDATHEIDGLTERPDGSWRLEMNLPSQVFPLLIGRRGETKKRVEIETRTQIKVPRQGVEGPLTVEGRDRGGVLSARTRIDVLVQMAREKMPFTHFLSLPMTLEEVMCGFELFRDHVLDYCGGDRGIDVSIFQNPKKLHLTLGVMVLLNDAEIDKATDLLQECREDLLEILETPMVVDCVGLEYMNDDPSEVDVLYMQVAPQDGSDRLQRMADRLVERFVSANLMISQYDKVKLHVTVMNTLFRKDPSGATMTSGSQSRGRPPRESFDVSNLLKRFQRYEFATNVQIQQVHLSQRFSTADDGYYTSSGTMELKAS